MGWTAPELSEPESETPFRFLHCSGCKCYIRESARVARLGSSIRDSPVAHAPVIHRGGSRAARRASDGGFSLASRGDLGWPRFGITRRSFCAIETAEGGVPHRVHPHVTERLECAGPDRLPKKTCHFKAHDWLVLLFASLLEAASGEAKSDESTRRYMQCKAVVFIYEPSPRPMPSSLWPTSWMGAKHGRGWWSSSARSQGLRGRIPMSRSP